MWWETGKKWRHPLVIIQNWEPPANLFKLIAEGGEGGALPPHHIALPTFNHGFVDSFLNLDISDHGQNSISVWITTPRTHQPLWMKRGGPLCFYNAPPPPTTNITWESSHWPSNTAPLLSDYVEYCNDFKAQLKNSNSVKIQNSDNLMKNSDSLIIV